MQADDESILTPKEKKMLWNTVQDNHSLKRFTVHMKCLWNWNVIFVQAKNCLHTTVKTPCAYDYEKLIIPFVKGLKQGLSEEVVMKAVSYISL